MSDLLYNKLLRGERVYLSSPAKEDIPAYTKWSANIDMQRFSAYDRIIPQTLGQTEERLKRNREHDVHSYTIRLVSDDTAIGNLSLVFMDWRNRSCMVGIGIGEPDYWGQGYGTEAMQIILRYAFLELNLHRVELGVFSNNPRAVRSYEKVGFQHEGVRRQAIFRDGVYLDMILMSILSHEWAERYGANSLSG